ncbi:MAG TPA: hypothetical protein VIF86_02880 [Methylobacter sp.]|jgi:hypothetical protein
MALYGTLSVFALNEKNRRAVGAFVQFVFLLESFFFRLENTVDMVKVGVY